MKKIISVVLLAALVGLSGCASTDGLSASKYKKAESRGLQEVLTGVVEAVREVEIEGTNTGAGASAGAGMGMLVGSGLAGGKVRTSLGSMIIGGLIGGIAGAAAEKAATSQKGLEITVRLDDGRLVAVTQGADESFQPGERVRVMTDSRTKLTRVVKDG